MRYSRLSLQLRRQSAGLEHYETACIIWASFSRSTVPEAIFPEESALNKSERNPTPLPPYKEEAPAVWQQGPSIYLFATKIKFLLFQKSGVNRTSISAQSSGTSNPITPLIFFPAATVPSSCPLSDASCAVRLMEVA